MNRIEINGRIMDTIEVRISEKGSVWVPFRLKHVTLGKDGMEHGMIVNCVAFGGCAQSMHTHLKKGAAIIVKGRLNNKAYVNKDGEEKESLGILVGSYELPKEGYGLNFNKDIPTGK